MKSLSPSVFASDFAWDKAGAATGNFGIDLDALALSPGEDVAKRVASASSVEVSVFIARGILRGRSHRRYPLGSRRVQKRFPSRFGILFLRQNHRYASANGCNCCKNIGLELAENMRIDRVGLDLKSDSRRIGTAGSRTGKAALARTRSPTGTRSRSIWGTARVRAS